MTSDRIDYLRRLDVRCHLELGFGLGDASLLYPDGVDRIIADELEHEIGVDA